MVNVMSLQSFSGSTGFDAYSASKAALHSLTQSLRPVLRDMGIALSGVYPGGIDTEMLREFDTVKSSARGVAQGILDAVEADEEDIFPDPVARLAADIWFADPKRFERLFAEPEQLVAVLEQARSEGRLELV
jgi:NAD(P)-dependent dehydrogenase (short-subunit alcohol dehydrogenase family)